MIKDTKFLNWEKAQRTNWYLYTNSYLVSLAIFYINVTLFGISNIQISEILKLQLDECMQMNAKQNEGAWKTQLLNIV